MSIRVNHVKIGDPFSTITEVHAVFSFPVDLHHRPRPQTDDLVPRAKVCVASHKRSAPVGLWLEFCQISGEEARGRIEAGHVLG